MTEHSFRLDRDHARFMGVCSGLTNATGIDTTLLRVLAVVLTFCFPVLLLPYLVAGFAAPR